jgi:hypothetical protein
VLLPWRRVVCGVVWCCVVKSGDVWYAATHRQHTGTRLGAPLYHGRPESAESLAAVNGRVLGPVVHDIELVLSAVGTPKIHKVEKG